MFVHLACLLAHVASGQELLSRNRLDDRHPNTDSDGDHAQDPGTLVVTIAKARCQTHVPLLFSQGEDSLGEPVSNREQHTAHVASGADHAGEEPIELGIDVRDQ